MYYDSFGSEQIGKAVQFFDYFIGSIRISKYYVRQEAIKNSLIKSTNNLLDVIAHAYLPEEVFDFITSHDDIQTIYENEDLDNDYGVRDRYKSRLLKYYNKKENKLAKRLEWIK
jgi:hypothetical protein